MQNIILGANCSEEEKKIAGPENKREEVKKRET